MWRCSLHALLALVLLSRALPAPDMYAPLLLSKLHPNLAGLLRVPAAFLEKKNVSNSRCLSRISHGLNHFLTDPTLPIILLNSGKGLNDLGDFEACGQDGSPEHYVQVSATLAALLQLTVGLCLPVECTAAALKETKPAIAAFLATMTGMKVSPDLISIQDVRETNRELNTATAGTGVFAAVVLVFLVVGVVATAADRFGLLLTSDAGGSTGKRLLQCFSLERNVKSLLRSENRIDPALEILNGVRVLSIGWVVLGHSFFFALFIPLYNLEEMLKSALEDPAMALIKGGNVSVDVFLMLSGFLAALGFCRAFARPDNRTIGKILMSYVHRYIRLLPILLLSIELTMYVQPLMYNTPGNLFMGTMAQQCKEQWPYVLLYANNFVTKMSVMCNNWSWYIFVDMQCFVVTPFVILIYVKSKRLGILAVLGICAASLAVQLDLCFHYEMNISVSKTNRTVDSDTIFYNKPYCRLLPYFMGMLLYFAYGDSKDPDHGISLFVRARQAVCSHPFLVRYPLYVLGFCTMSLVMYSFYFLDAYSDRWGTTFGAMHMVFSRPTFVLGLGMVLYPVLLGKGKILLAVLGHHVFNPLSKLTYGTYMLHLSINYVYSISQLQGMYYTGMERVTLACGVFLASYLASFLVSLAIESPVVMFLKNFVEARRPLKATISDATPAKSA